MKLKKTQEELNAYISGAVYDHELLTRAEMQRLEQQNVANGYGLTREEFVRLAKRHEAARAAFDIKALAKIEYRLTGINFHTICELLHNGRYEDAAAKIKEFYD